jgi:hypothetical protein
MRQYMHEWPVWLKWAALIAVFAIVARAVAEQASEPIGALIVAIVAAGAVAAWRNGLR